jgi:hypothetical protein
MVDHGRKQKEGHCGHMERGPFSLTLDPIARDSLGETTLETAAIRPLEKARKPLVAQLDVAEEGPTRQVLRWREAHGKFLRGSLLENMGIGAGDVEPETHPEDEAPSRVRYRVGTFEMRSFPSQVDERDCQLGLAFLAGRGTSPEIQEAIGRGQLLVSDRPRTPVLIFKAPYELEGYELSTFQGRLWQCNAELGKLLRLGPNLDLLIRDGDTVEQELTRPNETNLR